MNTLPNEVARLRPAEVATRRIPLPPIRTQRVLVGSSRQDIARQAGQLRKAQRLADTGEIHLMTQGQHAGLYVLPVTVIPAPIHPRWIKPTIIAGVCLSVLSAFGLTIAWLLVSLSPAALATLCALALVVLVALVRRTGRTEVRVTTVMEVVFKR